MESMEGKLASGGDSCVGEGPGGKGEHSMSGLAESSGEEQAEGAIPEAETDILRQRYISLEKLYTATNYDFR